MWWTVHDRQRSKLSVPPLPPSLTPSCVLFSHKTFSSTRPSLNGCNLRKKIKVLHHCTCILKLLVLCHWPGVGKINIMKSIVGTTFVFCCVGVWVSFIYLGLGWLLLPFLFCFLFFVKSLEGIPGTGTFTLPTRKCLSQASHSLLKNFSPNFTFGWCFVYFCRLIHKKKKVFRTSEQL